MFSLFVFASFFFASFHRRSKSGVVVLHLLLPPVLYALSLLELLLDDVQLALLLLEVDDAPVAVDLREGVQKGRRRALLLRVTLFAGRCTVVPIGRVFSTAARLNRDDGRTPVPSTFLRRLFSTVTTARRSNGDDDDLNGVLRRLSSVSYYFSILFCSLLGPMGHTAGLTVLAAVWTRLNSTKMQDSEYKVQARLQSSNPHVGARPWTKRLPVYSIDSTYQHVRRNNVPFCCCFARFYRRLATLSVTFRNFLNATNGNNKNSHASPSFTK